MKNTTLNEWKEKALTIENAINKVILGQEQSVRNILVAIFARGHVLLEGDVGVGKTTMLRAFSRAIGGFYERVEGTIDLMPNDLLYNTYIDSDGSPVMRPGPVIRHESEISTLFFNEINRARPQVHSLLLRVMAERSAQAFDKTYQFPYLSVFADRNQIEREETYELPAAARDRFFFEINVSTPKDTAIMNELTFNPRFHNTDDLINEIEKNIIDYKKLNDISFLLQTEVKISSEIQRYILALCHLLRNPDNDILSSLDIESNSLVKAGVSPRGMSMLVKATKVAAWLHGRDNIIPEDIHSVFFQSMAHRVFLTPVYEYRREEIIPDLFDLIVNKVPSP